MINFYQNNLCIFSSIFLNKNLFEFVLFNMQCGKLCYSQPNCFVFNIKTGDGQRECVLIEEIYSAEESFLYDYYIDFEGYHLYHGFVLYRGEYIKIATIQMLYDDAIQYCKDRKAEPYHPMDQTDNDFIVQQMKLSGLGFMWYPVNDIDVEGSFKWVNGSAVSPTDPVPWNENKYGYTSRGEPDDDCAQINSEGKVIIYWCGYADAGIVCKSNLKRN
ncbi:UNVERIFIED_CONTAM: hypothetical protein RMT77_019086 [Armadillidium vulgare]